jgi:hypothetical protein
MRMVYSDKPMEDFKESIARYEAEKQWWVEAKLDGWRCYIARDRSNRFGSEYLRGVIPGSGRDNSLYFFSRRDSGKGGPTPIPVKIQIVETVESWDLPDLSMLDSEWMARRTVGECPEKVFVFDTLWLADEWQGEVPYADRTTRLHFNYASKTNEHVDMPEQAKNGFAEFFAKMQTIPWTEGMVLKDVRGKIKGDIKGCIVNPLLVKIKWRSGSSGREIVR